MPLGTRPRGPVPPWARVSSVMADALEAARAKRAGEVPAIRSMALDGVATRHPVMAEAARARR